MVAISCIHTIKKLQKTVSVQQTPLRKFGVTCCYQEFWKPFRYLRKQDTEGTILRLKKMLTM